MSAAPTVIENTDSQVRVQVISLPVFDAGLAEDGSDNPFVLRNLLITFTDEGLLLDLTTIDGEVESTNSLTYGEIVENHLI